ncbi:ORF6N domain-containing protein [Pseudomonas citronellolis]|uniref:ORF6N domain-containing protein n=1 Tax=Pseudomonas citronellolis TaxID=53408 RepID=UPI00226D6D03|nr:ORF6N domain-containing protein [Pseudomonas citronellolis]WAB91943.1 ORF6N domain-containing protein [Pseudomonas citronellolis]
MQSGNEKAPGVGAPRALDNVKTTEELNVKMNHSISLYRVTPETLPAITYRGRRVVTTELLARLYGAEDKMIRNNFARNRDRFEAGKHFFKLEGDDLVELKNRASLRGSVGSKARSLILWTERGAARHAKMLDTERAWDVFERLEDSYFRSIEQATPSLPEPCYTLIGKTIGTDGFHCLGALLDGKLRRLPPAVRGRVRPHIWSQVHKAFSVTSAEQIPADQYDAARNFIAAYNVHEGEWMPKEEPRPDTFALDQYQAQDLNSLIHYIDWVYFRWNQGIGAALKAINPKFHVQTAGFFDEAQRAAQRLERALPELMAHFRNQDGHGLRPRECIARGVHVGHPAD